MILPDLEGTLLEPNRLDLTPGLFDIIQWLMVSGILGRDGRGISSRRFRSGGESLHSQERQLNSPGMSPKLQQLL
jgi:hypothetical protein